MPHDIGEPRKIHDLTAFLEPAVAKLDSKARRAFDPTEHVKVEEVAIVGIQARHDCDESPLDRMGIDYPPNRSLPDTPRT
jgi:hypothetical protein